MKGRGLVMNALALIIVIFLIVIMFCGCNRFNKYVVFMGRVDVDEYQISGSYKYFDGWFMKKLELEVDDSVDLNYCYETLGGSINVIVIDEYGGEVYSISENGEESTLTVCEDGYYIVKAVGDKHKGSFNVW